MNVIIRQGDCREVLATLPDESVHCVVTSPPYFGLRDYGTRTWKGGDPSCEHKGSERYYTEKTAAVSSSGAFSQPGEANKERLKAGRWREGGICRCGAEHYDPQIGLEPTPDAYVAEMVAVFREVRRVLRKDGTLWLNLGDSYARDAGKGQHKPGDAGKQNYIIERGGGRSASAINLKSEGSYGLKPKDLIGIPWRVAQALQAPYYTGRIKNERDRVWLAATLEAEGTICGFTHQRKDNGDIRRGVHIAITNSNVRMLDECYRVWSTSRHDHNPHGKGHLGKLDTFRWIAHGVEEKAQLLAELYPYMICKKSQALLAWNFFQISAQARGRNKGDEGDRNRERCAWIVHALSRLNRLEHVDIPAWLQEPPSMYDLGWYLRQDLIWSKPNPMPESVTDRCTKSHEYLFLLTKSEYYYYDADAIAEPVTDSTIKRLSQPTLDQQEGSWRVPGKSNGPMKAAWPKGRAAGNKSHKFVTEGGEKHRTAAGLMKIADVAYPTRNKRSVWEVTTQPFTEAHFATFPPALIEPCILAGCPKGGTVLDPFAGAGTTGLVADRLQRNAILIELSPTYAAMGEHRITDDAPLFADVQLRGILNDS